MALSAMTFAIGRRFIVADGVERWKEKELDPLIAALAQMPPDTTVAFFAREDSRAKAPKPLADAVKKAGGDVAAEESVKLWELPKWVVARARELGVQLDADAARALINHVGDRQQRLLRELEKIALEAGEGTTLDATEVEELTAPSAERKAWSLADALLSGDRAAATRLFVTLRAQGERVPGLLYWMTQRLRQAHEVAVALDEGESAAQVRKRLRMPQKAAEQLINDARRAGSETLRAAIEELAELELASRGGGGKGGVGEDTAALIAIQRIAA
jgi:DNA polymerase-3 subunit delta